MTTHRNRPQTTRPLTRVFAVAAALLVVGGGCAAHPGDLDLDDGAGTSEDQLRSLTGGLESVSCELDMEYEGVCYFKCAGGRFTIGVPAVGGQCEPTFEYEPAYPIPGIHKFTVVPAMIAIRAGDSRYMLAGSELHQLAPSEPALITPVAIELAESDAALSTAAEPGRTVYSISLPELAALTVDDDVLAQLPAVMRPLLGSGGPLAAASGASLRISIEDGFFAVSPTVKALVFVGLAVAAVAAFAAAVAGGAITLPAWGPPLAAGAAAAVVVLLIAQFAPDFLPPTNETTLSAVMPGAIIRPMA